MFSFHGELLNEGKWVSPTHAFSANAQGCEIQLELSSPELRTMVCYATCNVDGKAGTNRRESAGTERYEVDLLWKILRFLDFRDDELRDLRDRRTSDYVRVAELLGCWRVREVVLERLPNMKESG